MKAIPNPRVPLVGQDGRPTSEFVGVVPGVSAIDVIADANGGATPLFVKRLQSAAIAPLPMRAQLFNRDGTPTRVMTSLLAGLP